MPDPKEDWTRWLTEMERAMLKLHQDDSCEAECSWADVFRTIAALRALVEELRWLIEGFRQEGHLDGSHFDEFCIEDECSPGCRRIKASLALTEEEMRKRLEEK
jgi:hypothetical protein